MPKASTAPRSYGIFCTETGLPDFLVRDELALPAERVTAAFRQRLVGQEHAVSLMADLVAVIKAGLSDLGRPLGSFLFVGPTGVGKTETAKALAEFLFGSEQKLTRFDMSEFSGWDAVHRFLGRQDQEGKLVAAVRRRPFSIVLLDEIEKASASIFDVLLQLLGEARLTDEGGRTADFKNVVVIMTSNLGVDTLKRGLGFSVGVDRGTVSKPLSGRGPKVLSPRTLQSHRPYRSVYAPSSRSHPGDHFATGR